MITSTRYIIKHIIRIKLNDITRHNARVKLVTCKKYNFYGMSIIISHNVHVKLVTCEKYNFYGMESLDTIYM